MTRPVPIAASLALAALSFAALAQTQTAPATSESVPADAAPANAAPAPAPAAASTPATPVGSAARGKQLTFTCQGCHGVTGYKNAYPNYHVPRIGGQSAVYLTNALTEYKKGARKHPTMEVQAQSFSGQDIADIAAYLSELKQ